MRQFLPKWATHCNLWWIISKWAIEHKQSNKVIGSINIWNIDQEQAIAELGYGIVPEYQGKGLMKEALLQVAGYGFEFMKLRALDAYTEINNTNSSHLLKSCHFVEIKKVDEEGHFTKEMYRMVVYRLENK